MITSELHLYILVFNKESLQYEILSIDKDIIKPPVVDICKDSNINQMLNNIFTTYVNIDPSFINFILSDVNIKSEKLIINYYCLMPYHTTINNSYLLTLYNNEISSGNLRKIFSLL